MLSPFTVEFEDEEVTDSRNDGKVSTAGSSYSWGKLPSLLLVSGGRLLVAGLPCRNLGGANFNGATIPGDCDDIEVGVVSLLYAPPGPGDSENLVDGLALYPLPL